MGRSVLARFKTMAWRSWLAFLPVGIAVGPTFLGAAQEPGQQRNSCFQSKTVSMPIVVFRQDLADPDSAVLFYPVPAISGAPLIDPTNGRFALWRVEGATRSAPTLPGEELVNDSCPRPASMRVRVYVVRADDASGLYREGQWAPRAAEPVAGVEFCISTTRTHTAGTPAATAAPASWCDEVVTTEAFMDCPTSDGAPPEAAVRVGVLRAPSTAGPYLLVVEGAESPLQRLPEIVIPDRLDLASCIQTGSGWYAIPFRTLGPKHWFSSNAKPTHGRLLAGRFPSVGYFKLEVPGGADPYRVGITFRNQEEPETGEPPDSNRMDLRRLALLEDGRGVYLGAFLIVISPPEFPGDLPTPVLQRWKRMALVEPVNREKGTVVVSEIDRGAGPEDGP